MQPVTRKPLIRRFTKHKDIKTETFKSPETEGKIEKETIIKEIDDCIKELHESGSKSKLKILEKYEILTTKTENEDIWIKPPFKKTDIKLTRSFFYRILELIETKGSWISKIHYKYDIDVAVYSEIPLKVHTKSYDEGIVKIDEISDCILNLYALKETIKKDNNNEIEIYKRPNGIRNLNIITWWFKNNNSLTYLDINKLEIKTLASLIEGGVENKK